MASMIKATKITEEELTEVKQLQQDFSVITYQIGELSLQRELAQKQLQNINQDINNFISSFEKMQEKEVELIDRLKSTYPEAVIDLETGELS
jgi:predicted Rossmann fold nucleotide-binding protein DprA/Smf involved in DNA uptake